MASERHLLTAQLSSVGEQLRKALLRLEDTKANPGLFPDVVAQDAQDRVVELQHRYTMLRDCFRCIYS